MNMTQKPIIRYVRKRFSDLKHETNEIIENLGANPDDDCASFMAQDPELGETDVYDTDGNVTGKWRYNILGFDQVEKGLEFYNGLIRDTYGVDIRKRVIHDPGTVQADGHLHKNYYHWFLAPKNNLIQIESARYEKYKLEVKKREVFRRHGKDFPITRPFFADVFESGGFDESTYGFIRDNCIYAIYPFSDIVHGDISFFVFSENLDVFFDLVKKLAADDFDFISHSSMYEFPCY